MRGLSICLVSVTLAISAMPTAAVFDEDDYRMRHLEWQLGNECKPIPLLVELNKNARDIGLKTEAIETLARSRLRAARIYDETLDAPYLYININVSGSAVSVERQFKRWLRLPDGTSGIAVTWSNGATGVHGGRSDFIMQSLSQHVDEFIDKYLEANAEFCK